MNAWTVGQKVSLNRNSVVTIDRVTPSGRAFVGDRQYNPDGRERGGHSTYGQRGIEPLTPELLERMALVERYTKARSLMHNAAQRLIVWSKEHCSFYSGRVPNLAEIEQIERVASVALAALPIEKKVTP